MATSYTRLSKYFFNVSRMEGAGPDTIFQYGGAGIAYYKNGVGDADMSFHNTGMWVYEPLGENSDMKTVAMLATSNNSTFEGNASGPNIRIEHTRLVASEKYQNKADTETQHTVILQLATGRFTETFEVRPAGRVVGTYSGRCLILPTTSH